MCLCIGLQNTLSLPAKKQVKNRLNIYGWCEVNMKRIYCVKFENEKTGMVRNGKLKEHQITFTAK